VHKVAISVTEHAKAALIQQVFDIDWAGRHLLSNNPAYTDPVSFYFNRQNTTTISNNADIFDGNIQNMHLYYVISVMTYTKLNHFTLNQIHSLLTCSMSTYLPSKYLTVMLNHFNTQTLTL